MDMITTEVGEGTLSFSVEISPPKTDAGLKNLQNQISLLDTINPRTICVTSGAGGTDNIQTFSTIKHLENHTSSPPTAHLTCAANTKSETQKTLDQYSKADICNIVALRGDPKKTNDSPMPSNGYANAAELVRGIRERRDGNRFHISVAGYPEVHPKAKSKKADIESLKVKVDEGADLILTQFFFDPSIFFSFLEDLHKSRIDVPVVPGIILISDFPRIHKFAEKCGAHIPDWISNCFTDIESGSESANAVAEELALQQCTTLIENGVQMLHFFTLNRLDLTARTCESLLNEFCSLKASNCRKP